MYQEDTGRGRRMTETYCVGCKKMTESKRVGRCHYICTLCKADKSLNEVLEYEYHRRKQA